MEYNMETDLMQDIKKNIKLQQSHRRQALDILFESLGFKITKTIDDAIKVVIVKTIYEKNLMMEKANLELLRATDKLYKDDKFNK
jgi:hypothetical protein